MAIEQRHGKEYFYRKKRIGKKVVSEYVGGGEFDFLLYHWDTLESQNPRHQKNLRDAERYELETIDRELDDLEIKINEFLTAFLIGEDFIKHHRVNGDINKMADLKKSKETK